MAKGPRLPRYVELIRVSSQGQADRDTPEAQRQALDGLARSRPGTLVERIETVISGGKDTKDRPDIQRLVALATDKAFDELRVRHIDRITRHEDPRERFFIYGIVADAGAVIVEASGREVDPKSEYGELSYFFETMASAREKKRIRERVVESKNIRSKAGRLVSGVPPYGIVWDSDKAQWSIDKEKAKVVERVFQATLAGKGNREVADELNKECVPTVRGRKWTYSSVRWLLRRESLSGTYRYNDNLIPIPAVIDRKTWEEAQRILDESPRSPGAKESIHAFALFRKKLVCGQCGAHMRVHAATKQGPRRYACTTTRPSCRNMNLVDPFDDFMRDRLRTRLKGEVAGKVSGQWKPEDTVKLKSERKDIEAKLAALDAGDERLRRQLRKGNLTEKEFEKDKQESQQERRVLEALLRQVVATIEGEKKREQRQQSLSAKSILASMDKAVTREHWRAIVDALVDPWSIKVYPDGLVEAPILLGKSAASAVAESNGTSGRTVAFGNSQKADEMGLVVMLRGQAKTPEPTASSSAEPAPCPEPSRPRTGSPGAGPRSSGRRRTCIAPPAPSAKRPSRSRAR